MSTKPTADTPETRSTKDRFSRQIDTAFEEASKLAGSSLNPTEFYTQFLSCTLSAINAPAGVIWLRTPQGFLQIACQANLDKIGLDTRRGGRQCHNEVLRQVFQASPPRPMMVAPQERLNGVATDAGGIPAANLTDYYTLFAPIVTPDKQSLGLLEVFSDPNQDARLYQTFLQYTVQMAGYASQYHQFSNARAASGLERILTQIEAYAKQIHSSLNPTEVAYHVANEGRRLIECDRLCVGVRHGSKVTVEAVSGADVVEKASTHVRRMKALFDAVVNFGDRLVYKGSKDEGLPPDLSHALDEYLSESQPKLLVVLPVRDEREKDDKKARSVLLLESFNPPEQVEPLISKLEVVGKHAAGALYNASEVYRIPFGFLWRPLGKLQEGLGGKNRFIAFGIGTLVAVLLAVLVLVPYPLKMDAKGEFVPRYVKQVYAPHEGEVRELLRHSGDPIGEHGGAVTLFSPELQTKWMTAQQELDEALKSIAGINTILNRSLPIEQELDYRTKLASHEARAESRRKLLADLRDMYNTFPNRPGFFTAAAPDFDAAFRGVPGASWRVLSADNQDTLTKRTVRPNEPLLRLGYTEGPWRVELKMPQASVGHVLQAFADSDMHKTDKEGKKYLDVDVLLRSDPSRSYPGRLYQEDMAGEATPNRDNHNESEPIVLTYVRVNAEDLPADQKIPREQFVSGVEVSTRIRCGNHALGYSLFHGVWEWFYETVIFFF